MMIDVQHLQKRGNSWRYRRKVPKALRDNIGKWELIIPLGTSEAEALKRYPKAHAEAQRMLAAAALPPAPPAPVAVMSKLEAFEQARQLLKGWGFGDQWTGGDDLPEEPDPEWIARDVMAEQITDQYPSDEAGYPIGVSARDAAIVGALMSGSRQAPPSPTLEDAKRLYLAEKVGADKKKRLQLDRVFSFVETAIGLDRPILSLRRQDAKEVRDYMLDGREASSVDRYLNVVRAVINHAIEEFDLVGARNPFMKLEAVKQDDAEPDRRKRRSFTEEEVVKVRARIMSAAKAELGFIWRLVEGTGCRLAEVTGLRVEDAHLDHPIPYIDVEWHDDRRVKNKVSRRRVPLLGDTLTAAREAVAAAKGERVLFPSYCREGGSSSASAALGKHVRVYVSDPKVGPTHSLRHRMKDRLRLAGVSKADQDILLGHSSGNEGENYGYEEVRLEVAKRALEKALGPVE